MARSCHTTAARLCLPRTATERTWGRGGALEDGVEWKGNKVNPGCALACETGLLQTGEGIPDLIFCFDFI